MMNTKLIDLQNHPRIGAPPQDGLGLAVPGENPFRVSFPEPFRTEVLSCREKCWRACVLTPRVLWVWQRLVLLYPGQGLGGGTLQNCCLTGLRKVQLCNVVNWKSSLLCRLICGNCIHTGSGFALASFNCPADPLCILST